MLTYLSFAHMSTPLPRRPDSGHLLLTSRVSGGLRPISAGSTLTLPFSRPARRSLMFQPACSLIPLSGTFCTRGFDPGRYQHAPLRLLPAGATAAGWVIFLPLEWYALGMAH